MTIWDKLAKAKELERNGPKAPTPDNATSHGVICLTGPRNWSREDVDSGKQCQHIHPRSKLAVPWICLACNTGSAKAESIAAKHGLPAEVDVDAAEIKFKMKGVRPSKKLVNRKKSA
jgi:hypothetical protein